MELEAGDRGGDSQLKRQGVPQPGGWHWMTVSAAPCPVQDDFELKRCSAKGLLRFNTYSCALHAHEEGLVLEVAEVAQNIKWDRTVTWANASLRGLALTWNWYSFFALGKDL